MINVKFDFSSATAKEVSAFEAMSEYHDFQAALLRHSATHPVKSKVLKPLAVRERWTKCLTIALFLCVEIGLVYTMAKLSVETYEITGMAVLDWIVVVVAGSAMGVLFGMQAWWLVQTAKSAATASVVRDSSLG
jgi:hypothetical protein